MLFTLGLALLLSASVWLGLPDLSAHARIVFITFGLAVLGWVLTDINDTYIALAAAIVFTVLGADSPDALFDALGDSTIWLLLGAFIVAEAVTASGLSQRLVHLVARRARTVSQLFYALTGVLMLTAFFIPATSGRAALMVPLFFSLSRWIDDRRIGKALALLFPTGILLSAGASLIGAGAHLVTAEIVGRLTGETISFGRWLLLGLPFALVSCFVSTWTILHLFLTPAERRRPLRFDLETVAETTRQLTAKEKRMAGIALGLVTLWLTEPWHGLNNTLVVLLGALAVTMPTFGLIGFREGLKKVEWSMLLFMAATLELGEALVKSGGANWLVEYAFRALQTGATTSQLVVVSVVAGISLLSHLLITSRTARSTVLVPLVVLLGASIGYNALALAFLSTMAAGFCLTLPVSAKPVAMFSQVEDVDTYQARDLLQLSGVLLPIHFFLLLGFALLVWPRLGMPLTTPLSQPSTEEVIAVRITQTVTAEAQRLLRGPAQTLAHIRMHAQKMIIRLEVFHRQFQETVNTWRPSRFFHTPPEFFRWPRPHLTPPFTLRAG